MPAINRSAIVPYTAKQMFDLVDQIEAYPEFLPWCKSAIVLSRDTDEVRARLLLSYGGIQKSFATCNRLQQDKMIEMRLLEGPFSHLEGYWRFQPLAEEGCKVLLDLEFEFAGKIMGFAFGSVFSQAASTLVEAFCKRAEAIYG